MWYGTEGLGVVVIRYAPRAKVKGHFNQREGKDKEFARFPQTLFIPCLGTVLSSGEKQYIGLFQWYI